MPTRYAHTRLKVNGRIVRDRRDAPIRKPPGCRLLSETADEAVYECGAGHWLFEAF